MGYGTEMDGCGRFMKYSLFVSNFIIFIGGCTVAGLAIWALVDRVPFITELLENNLLTGAVYVLLVGGIIVAFISFFGCLGASREVKCMLLTREREGAKHLRKFSRAISCKPIVYRGK